MVALTLLPRRGYFRQRLDAEGSQVEEPVDWNVEELLEAVPLTIDVELSSNRVRLRLWRYSLKGITGFAVPVYFLDADLPENDPRDRALTGVLYGGDAEYRLRQEALLGLGGLRALRGLGHAHIARFHLNEGHAALLVIGLLEERCASAARTTAEIGDIEAIREQCVFTTHTPVPAGHDQLPPDLVRRVLGDDRWELLRACGQQSAVNMTDLALRSSRFVNGVAMRHGEVSRGMFPGYPIHSITNGVHVATWAAPSFQKLYDRHLPAWRRDALSLRYAIGIPAGEIWDAHLGAKRRLIDDLHRRGYEELDESVFTVGFARRATAYKRAALLFHDLDRLRQLAQRAGRIQLVFGGKAHPRDDQGKEMIRRVHAAGQALGGQITLVYVADYDMSLASTLCAGVDVWLNTPLPPLEASGTSGMKAAVNGVPSLSVLDGWWVEGHIEGVTGWAIADRGTVPTSDIDRADDVDARHADAVYAKLETVVLPCFYQDRAGFQHIMQRTIALNAAFFNTERMVWQYVRNACLSSSGV
jgi:starch phosphorylase